MVQLCSWAHAHPVSLIFIASFPILTFSSLFFLQVADYSLQDYPPIEKYITRMEAELPYFEEVNRPGIEAFKAFARS